LEYSLQQKVPLGKSNEVHRPTFRDDAERSTEEQGEKTRVKRKSFGGKGESWKFKAADLNEGKKKAASMTRRKIVVS